MGAPERELAARPSHLRTPPLVFGMVLFLASELMFFGGLFGAYFTLRGITEVWPPAGVELDVELMAVATGLLVASSFTMHAGTTALAAGRRGQAVRWLVVTFLLGTVFLVLKASDWVLVDFRVDSHAYGSLFFTMTGAHAIHLAAGLVLIAVVLGRMAQGAYRDAEVSGPDSVGWYWHFVDVVWLALFATIFLIQ